MLNKLNTNYSLMDVVAYDSLRKAFMDGYLENEGLLLKPRSVYTHEEEKIYQEALELAKEYVLFYPRRDLRDLNTGGDK